MKSRFHLGFMIILFAGMSLASGAGCSNLEALSPTYALTVLGSGTRAATSALSVGLPGARVSRPRTRGGSPVSLKVGVLAIYFGTKTDCTGLVAQEDFGVLPKTADLDAGPTLFNGNPAAGSYSCIAIKMKSAVTAQPDSVASQDYPGLCAPGTDYTTELYGALESPTWVDPTGATLPPGGGTLYFFASVSRADAMSGPLHIADAQISALNGPFTTPGTLTFYLDANGSMIATSVCEVGSAVAGFRF